MLYYLLPWKYAFRYFPKSIPNGLKVVHDYVIVSRSLPWYFQRSHKKKEYRCIQFWLFGKNLLIC